MTRTQSHAGPEAQPAPWRRLVRDVLAEPGRPLPDPVRADFDARFGHDFSHVRIHADPEAAASASAVAATAYTVGRHIVFSRGSFDPHTPTGRAVLAHELTHVVQAGSDATLPGPLRVARPDEPEERSAEAVARGSRSARTVTAQGSRAAAPLHRLGANPGCTPAERDDIHQAVFDARGWLAKAIPLMGESPLGDRARRSLRANFGPTYGVAANADLIRNRLVAARSVLSTMPISCAGAEDATCATNPCGWAVAGSRASTMCRNVTLVAGVAEVFQAGCVLHESFHATFARFGVDSYSGWHGHSSSSAGYPGPGVDPLLNADSYTTLVMDLS